MKQRSIKIIAIFGLVGIFGVLIAHYFHQSACPIYNTIGIPCPSCGMSRAVYSLLLLDIKSAFFYHPLVFVLPVIVYALIKEKKKLIIALIALILMVWVIRLIMFFPDVEPMNYNFDSLLGKFIN